MQSDEMEITLTILQGIDNQSTSSIDGLIRFSKVSQVLELL